MSEDHAKDVSDYVSGVVSGEIVTGRLARLAVWRYLDDLKNGPSRGFYFDPAPAIEFLDFTSMCCHTQAEWAGKPFEAEPWQKFCDWNIFGFRRTDGTRRFREDFEEVGRKNGKTTRCGPKCFYLSICDSPLEEGGQGYCVATKEDQAKLLFDELKRMVVRSPELKNYCNTFQRRIVFPNTQSYMQVLGSDSDSQDGFNPHFIIRDELHAWRERHRGLASKLATGFGSRRQPLLVTITTAGDEDSCIWQEDHDYAERVLESVITGEIIDDTFFAFIAAIDYRSSPCFRCQGDSCPWCSGTGSISVDDPFDETVWKKSNPNLNVSVKVEYLRSQANKAKQKPTALNEFLRYHCNVRVTSTQRAIAPEDWSACSGELSDWSLADSVHGGFDLGRSNDFASAGEVACFTQYDDSGESFVRYELRSKSFTSVKRDENMRFDFIDRWISEGKISASTGNAIDPNEVQDYIVESSIARQVKTWAYDKTFAQQMAISLLNTHGIEIFPFTQAAHFYNEPVRKLLGIISQCRKVNGKDVRMVTHDGCPVLAWQASNLVIRRNAKDEWMPDKGQSTHKIDAIVAILMAFSEALYHQSDESSGYYMTNSLSIGKGLVSNQNEYPVDNPI